jgi:hypothetical protein
MDSSVKTQNLEDVSHIPEDITKIGRIKDIYRYAKEDIAKSRLLGKAAIIGLLGITAYEWGPGNETFTPLLTGQFLDKADGMGGIALTAMVAGGFTAIEQLASSYLARKTTTENPNLSQRIYAHISDNNHEDTKFKRFKDLPVAKKVIYPFFLGSSFTVLREAYAAGEMDDEKLKKVGRLSAFITALSVSAIGAGVDTVNQHYADNELVQTALQYSIKSPIFWVSVMTGIFGYDYLKKVHKKNDSEFIEKTE